MKLFFILLCLTNVALLVWQLLTPNQPARAALPAIHTQQLVLLSEDQPAIDQACLTYGPFNDQDLAEQAQQRLASASSEPVSLREAVEQNLAGYRVLLPPQANEQAAERLAEQLQNRDITDYYVITQGEFMHAISLGVFRRKSGAERRMQAIRELGMTPEMDVRYRDTTIYWLDTRSPADQDGQLQALRELQDDVQQLNREC